MHACIMTGKYINASECSHRKAYDAQNVQSPKLTQKIAPGRKHPCAFSSSRCHQGWRILRSRLDHGFTPGYFVIGESPFFHKPDIHQLPGGR